MKNFICKNRLILLHIILFLVAFLYRLHDSFGTNITSGHWDAITRVYYTIKTYEHRWWLRSLNWLPLYFWINQALYFITKNISSIVLNNILLGSLTFNIFFSILNRYSQNLMTNFALTLACSFLAVHSWLSTTTLAEPLMIFLSFMSLKYFLEVYSGEREKIYYFVMWCSLSNLVKYEPWVLCFIMGSVLMYRYRDMKIFIHLSLLLLVPIFWSIVNNIYADHWLNWYRMHINEMDNIQKMSGLTSLLNFKFGYMTIVEGSKILVVGIFLVSKRMKSLIPLFITCFAYLSIVAYLLYNLSVMHFERYYVLPALLLMISLCSIIASYEGNLKVKRAILLFLPLLIVIGYQFPLIQHFNYRNRDLTNRDYPEIEKYLSNLKLNKLQKIFIPKDEWYKEYFTVKVFLEKEKFFYNVEGDYLFSLDPDKLVELYKQHIDNKEIKYIMLFKDKKVSRKFLNVFEKYLKINFKIIKNSETVLILQRI